jgi:hypothetical protein
VSEPDVKNVLKDWKKKTMHGGGSLLQCLTSSTRDYSQPPNNHLISQEKEQ